MNLMFWKKKKADAEDGADDSPDKSGARAGSDATPESQKSPDHESSHRKTSSDEPGEAESEESAPASLKRLIIIGAVAGVLILTGIGAIWKVFSPSPEPSSKPPKKPEAATADTTATNQLAPLSDKPLIKLPPIEFAHRAKAKPEDQPAEIEDLKKKYNALQTEVEALKTGKNQPEKPRVEKAKVEKTVDANSQADIEALEKQDAKLQAEIELLRTELPKLEKAQAEQQQANIDAIARKNSDLQAQIETLRKKRAAAMSAGQAPRKVSPVPAAADISIGTQDPKAAALSLKEAIKAMNAASEEPQRKPAR